MSFKFHFRLGGYGPPTTSFSQSLKFIGDRLEAEFGDDVEVKYIWNIMDLGYPSVSIKKFILIKLKINEINDDFKIATQSNKLVNFQIL